MIRRYQQWRNRRAVEAHLADIVDRAKVAGRELV